jgi:DNA-binding transcriptional LysR family regulator
VRDVQSPRLRASSMLMHLEAIRAGTGRGVLPCYVGDGHPLLERLTPPIPEIAAEYWIIVHRDLRRSPCVRAVIDWMKRLFAEQRDVLAGVARERAATDAVSSSPLSCF